MQKPFLWLLAVVFILNACNSNNSQDSTSGNASPVDMALLKPYAALMLPFTTSTTGEGPRPTPIDSVKANALQLKKMNGGAEWLVFGVVNTKHWTGIVYDVLVNDVQVRVMTIYTAAGNKTEDLVLFSSESACFGPDRDCMVEVILNEDKIERTELYTRYNTTNEVETPVERIETVTVFSIDSNGKTKEESSRKKDLTNIMTEETMKDFFNAAVVYKDDAGQELRLEVHGQNHETLWYYNNGKEEIQVVPMIGENDIYALIDNNGKHVGTMQLLKIERGNDIDIAGEIELSVNNKTSLFKQVSVID